MAEMATASLASGPTKGIWAQLRDNPFLLGLSMVCSIPTTYHKLIF